MLARSLERRFSKICTEKYCIEVEFTIAKQLFAAMSNETITFASEDVKWKEKLLKSDLLMD